MRKAFIQLHIAVFLAGFTGVLGRLITLNEAVLVWYRLMITCVALAFLGRFKKEKPAVPRSQRIRAASIGLILAVHWVTFYWGIKISTVSTALVCLSAMGFFTAILEPLMLRKPFDFAEVLLGLIAVAGISIVFHFDPKYKTGIIISLLSALLASIFPILNRQLMQTMDAETATRYQLNGGFFFITILMPVYLHFVPVETLWPSPSDWMWLFVLGVLCTAVAFELFMKALQIIPAFTVNLTYNLEPIYGIGLAFLIYREDKLVSSGFYYGLALIMAAVILQSVRTRRIARRTMPLPIPTDSGQ